MEIFKKYSFDSAHFLPHVSEDHKCKQMHGHTYLVTLFFKGALQQPEGWIMDFSEIKKIVDPIIKSIDHKILNHVEGLENPTCENLAAWIWVRIKTEIPILSKIELYETPTSGVTYRG
jgi:6-pyruvoyltetrahydropterin/6-carboxytetrahydropterin synthase